MNDFLYAIASVGFFLWIGRNIVFWTQLMKQEGYSLKQTKAILFSSSIGRTIIFSPLSLLKWIVIFFYPVVIFHEGFDVYYHFFITLLYGWEIVNVVKELSPSALRNRAFPSMKSMGVMLAAFLLSGVMYLIPPLDKFLWLVLVDRFTIVLILFIFFLSSLPEEFYWDYKAVSLLKNKKDSHLPESIFIIGGGETQTVKEITMQALKTKYTVASTEENADKQTIIKKLSFLKSFPNDYFVTDCHKISYNSLEELLTLIAPRYIILTTPSVFLLGTGKTHSKGSTPLRNKTSLESIVSLIMKSTPQNGKLFVNSDDDVGKLFRGKKVTYFGRNSGTNIQLRKDKTFFSYSLKGKTVRIETQLVSAKAPQFLYPVLNLLASLGFSAAAMRSAIKVIPASEGFLQYDERDGVSLLINTRETDLMRLPGLSTYVKQYSGKKVLILDPGIIVGERTKKAYHRIGLHLSQTYDYVFLLNSSTAKAVREGVTQGKKSCFVSITSVQQAVSYLKPLLEKGDTAIFFGSGSGEVLQKYRTQKKKGNVPSGL